MGTQSKMLWGYGVDGRAFYVPVTLPADEIICPKCEGQGTLVYDDGVDGFEKLSRGTCNQCDGAGVLAIEIVEEE